MKITFNIEAGTPEELQNAIAGLAGVMAEPVEVSKDTKQTKAPVAPKQEDKPAGATKPASEPKEEPAKEKNVPSLTDLRALAKEKGSTAENKAAIKELLKSFECKSISAVPAESRRAFMDELEVI